MIESYKSNEKIFNKPFVNQKFVSLKRFGLNNVFMSTFSVS